MRRSRAIQLLVWFGLTSSAVGCAQLAGLTEDYHLASAGAGALAGGATAGGEAGRGDNGGLGNDPDAGGTAGDTEAGGDSGASAGGGQPGTSGAGGDSGARAGGGHPGTSGAGGSNGSSGSNGSNGSSGSSGSSSSAGSTGLAGSGGGAPGPTRVGYSMFHDSAFGNDNASAHLTDATFSKPSGTRAGDLIFVFFGADHSLAGLSGNTLNAAGWTLLDQHSDYGYGDGQAAYLIYKFAGNNEPDPIVFPGINSATYGNGVQGLLSVYRGVSPSNPIDAYEYIKLDTGMTGTKAVTATPAITTTVANCLLITGLSPDTTIDRPVIDTWPEGFDENQVSVVNAPNPYPLGWANIYAAERHLSAAGTVPASAFHWTMTNDTDGGKYFGSLTFVLALSPQP